MEASNQDNSQPANVLVAGGGVAGLEAVLALRDLAGDAVSIALLAPDDDFVYRPLSVGEPFALGDVQRLPLKRFASDTGVELVADGLAAVDPAARSVRLTSGGERSYDALLVATGAPREPAFDRVITFRGQEDIESMHGLVQDLEGGYARCVAFVVPHGVVWSLPLYELALMSARRAREMGIGDARFVFVTPEERPLAIFGATASGELERMLTERGIELHTSSRAEVPRGGHVEIHPGGEAIDCDRIVALPQVRGPRIEGLPHDGDGFVPIDGHGRVSGADGVFAAGDGANFPVKQGGMACQQADAAAAQIAADAGASVDPAPFRPVLRGQLLTGGTPQFMRADISGAGGDDSQSADHTLWWPPAKIAGRYLAPYLHGAARGGERPEDSELLTEATGGGHEVELSGVDAPGSVGS
jgi:sulfide:quinone oxidoreductase